MYQFFNSLSWMLLVYSVAAIFFSGAVYIFQKDKIYRGFPEGWLDVKTHKIPKDIICFIATDGKKVDIIYQCNWAPYGEIYFNRYKNTYVTHWQPLPDAPK